ncbi:MAG: ankyrin repeat domain-containing protein, partial [Candidatus Thorarchaeota archaeon]
MNEANDGLLVATEKGNLEGVKAAIESGAEIDAQNEFMKDSALHIASSKGHLDIVEYLIDNNADCLLANGTDMTPLHLAARDGQTRVVKYLLAKIREIPERVLNDIIHVASVSVYGRPEIVQMLEDYRVAQVRPDTSDAMGASELLLEAAENGDLDEVLQACHSGADVNVVDGRGMMPIHWAAL